jgi:predicted HicB family RNase H-like nuclease
MQAEGREAMTKRFVEGLTYNTDTATRLAFAAWDDDENTEVTLYQTRGGAFFLHEVTTKEVWVERSQEHQTKGRNAIIPQSADEAQRWLFEHAEETFLNPFENPPESEQDAAIYIRVPSSLKQRIEQAASEAKLSGNAWVIRCLERCLAAGNP